MRCSINSPISFARANSPADRRSRDMPSGEDDSANETSGEERLIGRYFRPLATTPGAFALGDDAAVLPPPPGCDLVLSTDGVTAGEHFLAEHPPDIIARNALRMNLADLPA